MFGLGTQEFMVVLVIIVILFGATRLPKIGSGLGQAIRNFKKSVAEAKESNEIQNGQELTQKENV
jgi:sec-independent protein translocase protein TatA